jgi:hypothetical protein
LRNQPNVQDLPNPGTMEIMKTTILALLLAVALVPAALAAAKPSVRLLVPAPATVVGTGFHPHERVRVTVQNGPAALHKTVRTGALGQFKARFTVAAPGGTCGQMVVAAVGFQGDHAGWKSPPRMCGTQLQP